MRCRSRSRNRGYIWTTGHRQTSGFTLVELVISSALMTIILSAAYLCLRAGFAGEKLVQSRSDLLQTARIAMGLMSADLRSATPLSLKIEFSGLNRAIGELEADNVDFATHQYTPRRPGEGDFCEVSYFVNEDPQSKTLTLWRRRDATPDPEPVSGGTQEQIAQGLRGLKLEYYDGFEWYDEWGDPEGQYEGVSAWFAPGNISGMPKAVRITLILSSAKPGLPTDGNGASDDLPLAFQTVVHLALAAQSGTGATSSSSDSSSQQNSDQ